MSVCIVQTPLCSQCSTTASCPRVLRQTWFHKQMLSQPRLCAQTLQLQLKPCSSSSNPAAPDQTLQLRTQTLQLRIKPCSSGSNPAAPDQTLQLRIKPCSSGSNPAAPAQTLQRESAQRQIISYLQLYLAAVVVFWGASRKDSLHTWSFERTVRSGGREEEESDTQD